MLLTFVNNITFLKKATIETVISSQCHPYRFQNKRENDYLQQHLILKGQKTLM